MTATGPGLEPGAEVTGHRPERTPLGRERRRTPLRVVLLVGLAVSLVLAGVVSIFASSNPDGLEFVAERLGFDGTAGEHALADSPLADYAVRGLGDGGLSTGLSGIIGVAVVALLAFGLIRLLRRPGPPRR